MRQEELLGTVFKFLTIYDIQDDGVEAKKNTKKGSYILNIELANKQKDIDHVDRVMKFQHLICSPIVIVCSTVMFCNQTNTIYNVLVFSLYILSLCYCTIMVLFVFLSLVLSFILCLKFLILLLLTFVSF